MQMGAINQRKVIRGINIIISTGRKMSTASAMLFFPIMSLVAITGQYFQRSLQTTGTFLCFSHGVTCYI